MSSINKIKLPNGTTYDVNDVRIPGVDTTVTSGSSNVVTSGAVASAIPTTVWTSGTGTNSAQQKGTGAVATNTGAVAEGIYTTASGQAAHAEGAKYESNINTTAAGDASHAEGASTQTKGQASHSEGLLTTAGRTQAEAVAAVSNFPNLSGTTEQKVTKLIGFASHAEGSTTQALGTSSHAEGNSTQALVNTAHAEGDTTTASGEAAHSEGYNTTASGNQSHSEGFNTQATANQAHSEGKKTIASAENAHSEGNETKAVGNASHSEGYKTYAYGAMSHIEGTSSTLVSNANAASESVESIWEENGHNFSLSRGQGSHVEGKNCLATGDWSHAEGVSSSATKIGSHAEGNETRALEVASHAEGYNSNASGLYSHSEGFNCLTGGDDTSNNRQTALTTANGSCAHAEGSATIAQGACSHAEGQKTFAKYFCSHAEGRGTKTKEECEHAEGRYNVGLSNCIHEVGIGNGTTYKNAHTITTDGKHYIPGIGTYTGTETTLPSGQDLASIIGTKAPLASPALTGTPTAPTATAGTNTTQIATTAFVKTAIDNLPEPMIFKGSLGTGGTITSLPTASASNEGYTYKVITAGTYESQAAKVGDTFISTGSEWVLIPSGDEPSGTVTSVGMSVPTGLSVSGSPVTSSGTLAVSFASGYSIPTTAKQANWDTAYTHSQSTHARTDATAVASSTTNGNIKINGTETTVYTHPSQTAYASGLYKITTNSLGHVTAATAVAKSDITALGIPGSDTDTKNTAGSTDTSSKIFLIGATSQAANPQTYSDNEVFATSGVLTTKSVQVGGGPATMEYDSTNKCVKFVFA